MANSLEKKRSGKSYILSIGFILLCAIVLIIYLFTSGDVKLLPGAFVWPRSAWLLLAAVVMIASWLVESGVLYKFAIELAHPISYRVAFRATMVVQFFNNITPSSSGGQPMQIWSLWRDGMPVGESTTIQLGKYLIYQSTLMLCSIVALILDFGELSANVGAWRWLFIVSFLIQVVILAFVILLIVRPSAMRWLIVRVEKIVSHTPLKAKMAGLFAKADVELDNFEQSAVVFTENPKMFGHIFLLTLLQLLLFYTVPFCVCRSLGVAMPLWKAIAAAAFVLMVSGIVPLPGASGGAEGTFVLVFGTFFPEGSSVAVAVFLWRLLTFYFPVIAGAPFCTKTAGKTRVVRAKEQTVYQNRSMQQSAREDALPEYDERPLAGINPQTGQPYPPRANTRERVPVSHEGAHSRRSSSYAVTSRRETSGAHDRDRVRTSAARDAERRQPPSSEGAGRRRTPSARNPERGRAPQDAGQRHAPSTGSADRRQAPPSQRASRNPSPSHSPSTRSADRRQTPPPQDGASRRSPSSPSPGPRYTDDPRPRRH